MLCSWPVVSASQAKEAMMTAKAKEAGGGSAGPPGAKQLPDIRDLQREACLRVAACSFELHERLHKYEAAPGVFLSLHMGMSTGVATGMHAGGIFNRWEYVILSSLFSLQTTAALTLY
jgi:hypothetical protein